MLRLLTQPPPTEAIARMAAVEGVHFAPTMLSTQRGPDAQHGPEAAGAVLLLQGTFVDASCAEEFWRSAAVLTERLSVAPGFIRRYNFTDGPHFTSFALWRTAADAHAFFASDAHQAAMRELFRRRLVYTHFAALWQLTSPRQRLMFCQQCEGVTPSTEHACSGCGTELIDPFTTWNATGSCT